MIKTLTGKVLFTDDELACSCCGQQKFADGFEGALASLRLHVGIAMPLTSACRCPSYNEAIGGHPRSLHLTESGRDKGTCAVDVACSDGGSRLKLIQAALNLGWSVGIASNFIHLDERARVHGLEQRVFHYAR